MSKRKKGGNGVLVLALFGIGVPAILIFFVFRLGLGWGTLGSLICAALLSQLFWATLDVAAGIGSLLSRVFHPKKGEANLRSRRPD